MKQQWTLIFALVFALIIAVFSVVNVESVPVDYVFGTAQFPLIMVILGSALAGGLTAALFGTIRIVRQSRQIRALQKELQALKAAAQEPELPSDPTAAVSSGANPAEAPQQETGPQNVTDQNPRE